jgi:phosphoribosyl 1,2-cyclic phosphodiesterase
MSLFISSLNSGSNGNCYYVGNSTEAVLVDAGISCKETEKRMKRLGLSMDKVKAIFVSHEHSDHIRGIPVLAKKYSLPVYATPGTIRKSYFGFGKNTLINYSAAVPVQIGSLSITAFPKLHDAADPHSFVVECNGTRVGVLTDIGAVCGHVEQHFNSCHAVFLESNYDEEMLHNGKYPIHLKRRISGGEGHLSNIQALQLFKLKKGPQLQTIILSHLSRENNCPQLVRDLFAEHADGVQVVVASRYEETPVFSVAGEIAAGESLLFSGSRPGQIALF